MTKEVRIVSRNEIAMGGHADVDRWSLAESKWGCCYGGPNKTRLVSCPTHNFDSRVWWMRRISTKINFPFMNVNLTGQAAEFFFWTLPQVKFFPLDSPSDQIIWLTQRCCPFSLSMGYCCLRSHTRIWLLFPVLGNTLEWIPNRSDAL